MTDTKRTIEHAGQQAPAPEFTLDDVRGRRDREHRRRRLAGGCVGAGVTVALVAAAVLSLGSFGDPGRAIPLDGGEGLPAATGVSVAIGPGDYTYQHVQMFTACAVDPGGDVTLCPNPDVDVETWWKADGSGRIAVTAHQNYGIDAGTFGPGELRTEGDVSGYPLDPDALQSFLLERSGPDGSSPRPDPTLAPGVPAEDGLLWNAIRDYLGSTQYPNTTPALRAAMLQVLASLPMVTVDNQATDPFGRPAVALRFVTDGGHVTVYVDPVSHDFLGLTNVYPGEGSSGAVMVRLAGAAASIDDRPIGDSRSVAAP